jgi:hypothetical protein
MTWLLSLIPGLFTTINGITTAISNERIALINAKTDQEKNAIQERINVLNNQRDVLVADSQRSSVDIYIRALIALVPAIVLYKLMVWDKVIGSFWHCNNNDSFECQIFNTDKLDPNMWWVILGVVGFYFLTMKRK